MPPSPDERRFYTRILEILGAPYSIREQLGALEGRVIHLLQKLGTKLLFIDEATICSPAAIANNAVHSICSSS